MPSCYTKKKGTDRNGNPRFRPDDKKFLFNIDTFWYNIDILNYNDVMENGLLDELEEGRDFYLDHGESKTISVPLPNYENPLVFEVQLGQKPLYQFSLRNEDIAIYFARRYRDDGQYPVKVQINQFLLWDKGLINAYAESLGVLMSFGFATGKAKMNRIDFAVHSDQWEWVLDDLKTFEYPRNFKDDNKPDFFRLDPCSGEFETVYFGNRTRLQLRIYNKTKEIMKKGKMYFLDLYQSLGMDTENIWNVEFEVRRDFLKECEDEEGLKIFDDLEEVFNRDGLDKLWTMLMEKFYHDSAFWTQLSKGAKGKFARTTGYLIRTKDVDSNFDREVAQIRGRLMTAVINDENCNIETAVKKFLIKNRQYEEKKGKSFVEDVEKKKMLLHDYEINKTIKKETLD
ncbi:replication initiation protein [Bacillus cereus]|uniref:replication initiation protein n=1 Tax=Bacillus cereus TaxID=1396 RepID=UPI000BF6E788|nr:replication initiation protein [Bacillus cereus]PFD63271.1 replication initiation protein [Bacillus cereus]